MAKLKEMQAADDKSHSRLKRKLVKTCRTCWLSYREAVNALKTKLSSVYATLHFFATEKKDCTAIGVLQLSCSKHFFISCYLLNAVLEHPKKISMLFQKRNFNFSHVQSALSISQKKITNLVDSDWVVNSLKFD